MRGILEDKDVAGPWAAGDSGPKGVQSDGSGDLKFRLVHKAFVHLFWCFQNF